MTNGYGAWGPYAALKDSVRSPLFAGRQVEVFHPQGLPGPRPTIFFSHGFGGNQSDFYSAIIAFLVSKGFTVVFSPYPTLAGSILDRYEVLWEGFLRAASTFPQYIDVSRVGFAGHSFGAGASFSLARRAITEVKWGNQGKFIFSMAPWYLYGISSAELRDFPAEVKVIVQVYAEDVVNDHRIAIDAFQRIGVANSEKDYVWVPSDRVQGFDYASNHTVPSVRSGGYDAIDSWAVFRLIEALADYTFTGNAAAKTIALGNGGAAQITMPTYNGYQMKPLVVSDQPQPQQPESYYEFACSNLLNPRRDFCGLSTGITAVAAPANLLYPNPLTEVLQIDYAPTGTNPMVEIYDAWGRMVHRQAFAPSIGVAQLPTGWYMVALQEERRRLVWRVVKP